MRYIECPQKFEFANYWSTDKKDYSPTVFLAGSISECFNWQSELVQLLSQRNITLINPRRQNFDINKENLIKEQIEWEYHHLRRVDIISFWFSYETLAPITLFELGSALHTDSEIVVGCHPDYKRREDVIFQCRLVNPYIKVVNDLLDLSENIIESASHFV